MALAFFFGCLFATWFGRKLGWAISRSLLYSAGWPLCVIVCLIWGVGLAYGLRQFILATNPGLLLKIFGYGTGMYISIPNYGLVDESTMPESQLPRHVFIKGVPWFLFMAASALFAFTALGGKSV